MRKETVKKFWQKPKKRRKGVHSKNKSHFGSSGQSGNKGSGKLK